LQLAFVEDAECLYRSVPLKHFPIQLSGERRISSQAFTDREKKISVDRACLCDNDPEYSKKSLEDGVAFLFAWEIRAIKDLYRLDAKQNQVQQQNVDVQPDPILKQNNVPDNPAHALIIAHPDFENKRVFQRLIERLARLAEQNGWLIAPAENP
jgi:hypothetical protein